MYTRARGILFKMQTMIVTVIQYQFPALERA